jgi:hypothetical protein
MKKCGRGIEKKKKKMETFHTGTVSPRRLRTDPFERPLHDRSPWITQAEISAAADDFCLIGFWRGVVNGSRSIHPPKQKRGKMFREKKKRGRL